MNHGPEHIHVWPNGGLHARCLCGATPERDCRHGCNGDCVVSGSDACNFTCHPTDKGRVSSACEGEHLDVQPDMIDHLHLCDLLLDHAEDHHDRSSGFRWPLIAPGSPPPVTP